MSEQAMPLYELGVRVILCGSHSHAGQEGTLWVSPARVFNGWTVKLDSGHYVGASEAQMVSERAADTPAARVAAEDRQAEEGAPRK